MEKFTKAYVDAVVTTSDSKNEVRKFLRHRLLTMKNQISLGHYLEMRKYINDATE